MLSRRVTRVRRRSAFLRSSAVWSKSRSKVIHRAMRGGEQLRHFIGDAFGIVAFPAALFDLAEAMAQRLDQRIAATRIIEQVVLQVGIPLDHPDVAEHFVQHAGGASGAPLAAQFVEHLPHRRAKQANDDFAVGERRVVVGNLAEPDAGGREWRYGLHLNSTACLEANSTAPKQARLPHTAK